MKYLVFAIMGNEENAPAYNYSSWINGSYTNVSWNCNTFGLQQGLKLLVKISFWDIDYSSTIFKPGHYGWM